MIIRIGYLLPATLRLATLLLVTLLLVTLLLLLAGSARAQPYAAGGGFDRPWQVARVTTTSRLGLAAWEEGAVAYWSDAEGVLTRDLETEGTSERIFEGRGVRELTARQVMGNPAVAWAHRDLATARTNHWLSWNGEARVLIEAAQPYEMKIVETADGPGLLYSRRERSGHILRIVDWQGGETVVRRSDDSLVKYSAHSDPDGTVAVAWLEGYTRQGALGAASDWTAYTAEVTPRGEVSEPVRLGAARNLGLESQTALGRIDGDVAVLWPGPDGEVLLSAPRVQARVLGMGSPLALRGGDAYWWQGRSIRRTELNGWARADGSTAAEPTSVNVAWSPVTVARAQLGTSGATRYLLWGGPSRGGDYLIYASDDRRPMQVGLKDRVGAAMGWNPWGFWEAFVAQLLGALFAGLLISIVLSPLLLLGATVALRTGVSRNGTWTGIAIGAALLLLLLGLIAANVQLGTTYFELFGTIPELVLGLLTAGAVTWLVRRHSDSEQMLGVMTSGYLFLFLTLSFMAFLTFQDWLSYWSRLA